MAHILAQVTLPHTSGLPKDVTVNTFHFDADPASGADQQAIGQLLEDFYNEAETGNPVAYYLSTVLSRGTGASTVELYDMTQPKPRVPIFLWPWTLGVAGTTGSLPNEVCLVSSFYASPAAGSPQARRRGRVYLGPLTSGTGNTTQGQPARPGSAVVDSFSNAGFALAVAAQAAGTPWCVYSRVDSVIRPVVGGWVDNEFDTQRRRQPSADSRTPWTLSV